MAESLRWPLERSGGTLIAVEQDSIDEVAQGVQLLLRTRPGDRPLAPTLGVPDPTFSAAGTPDTVAAAVAEWEPRAAVDVQVLADDASASQTRRVFISLSEDDA